MSEEYNVGDIITFESWRSYARTDTYRGVVWQVISDTLIIVERDVDHRRYVVNVSTVISHLPKETHA